jgi:hypothetical protein
MVVVVHELRLAERLVVPSTFWWLLEDFGQSLTFPLAGSTVRSLHDLMVGEI